MDAPGVLHHVKDMKELNRNPWSGHSAIMGYVKREWQDTDYVWSFFGRGHEGKRRYQAFVNGGIEEENGDWEKRSVGE